MKSTKINLSMVSERGMVWMLTISIDHSETADYIYQQIYQHIKAAVLKRSLMPHTKVPSKRELAETLKVSVNSVNSAYQRYAFGRLFICSRKKRFFRGGN